MSHPFRFGFQLRTGTADELRDQARRAEAAGFDLVCSWDHISDGWTALLPLLAMAEAAPTIRVCPMVINNDFHHPVHLAGEIASLDALDRRPGGAGDRRRPRVHRVRGDRPDDGSAAGAQAAPGRVDRDPADVARRRGGHVRRRALSDHRGAHDAGDAGAPADPRRRRRPRGAGPCRPPRRRDRADGPGSHAARRVAPRGPLATGATDRDGRSHPGQRRRARCRS